MFSDAFHYAARTGVILGGLALPLPVSAHAVGDTAFLHPGGDIKADVQTHAELYSCMIKAATVPDQAGARPVAYQEDRFTDPQEGDIRAVVSLRPVNAYYQAGSQIYLKSGVRGSGSLSVLYLLASSKSDRLDGPLDTFTQVDLDKDDLSAPLKTITRSGKQVPKEIEVAVRDHALRTASLIVQCMAP